MPEDLWTYSATCGHLPATDLTGWDVEATDGPVGPVTEHADDAGEAHLVVDAGAWIFGEVLIPAGGVAEVDTERRVLRLTLTREQVKDAPQFLSDRHLADPQYREDVAAYYRLAVASCEGSAGAS
ncbi:PRC-barrel domain containing protein [Streptomyces sp. NPDC088707]|uniref:PRC-barrel domain containing protein n=1 Tax=Streptomyces sp. NPDC088707 TaxID=3365871 RepID=UPI0037F517FE